MAQLPDKVTMIPNATYSPYNNLKNTDMKADSGGNNTTTLRSRVETTISGRRVFRPIRK